MRYIAAFDFDGTLTDRDTLLPFLLTQSGYMRGIGHIVAHLPSFLQLLGSNGQNLERRKEVKEGLLKRFLGGRRREDVLIAAEQFMAEHIECWLRPTMMKRLLWHREQGHYCVIVSANLDLCLNSISRYLPVHHILSSRLECDASGMLTGRLAGKNCWGADKVAYLEDLLGPRTDYFLYAYGDSRGDKELLAFADSSWRL